MRTTIKDVARRAGVSTATVSLAIHGNERIPSTTKRKVQRAIEELNYHPSRSARDLVSKKSGNIGFVLTEDHFLRTEPFYTKIFLGSEFEARKHSYYVLLATVSNNYIKSDPLPRFILEKNADGLIIAGKVPAGLIDNLEKTGLPAVYVDYFPAKGEQASVLIDNLNGGIQATQHLIDCGHQSIAFIAGDIIHPSIRDRFQGYRIALDRNNLEFKSQNVITTEEATSRESGYHATSDLLKKSNGITAIFACNDAMAIGSLQYLKGAGYHVPADISIIGFDDVEGDLFVDPPITTMRVPKLDMGGEALRLLSELLVKKEKIHKKVLMPVELVLRKSTCTKSS